jgi:hypothetical protein
MGFTWVVVATDRALEPVQGPHQAEGVVEAAAIDFVSGPGWLQLRLHSLCSPGNGVST